MKISHIVLVLCLAQSVALAQQNTSASQEEEPVSVTNLQVVDSRSKSLGNAHLNGLFEMSVIMQVEEHFVLLPVTPFGFAETRATIGFTTPDCTGQAYLISAYAFDYFLVAPAAVTLPGNTLWVPNGEPLTIIQRQSVLSDITEVRPTGCYFNVEPFSEFATPAKAVVQLDSLFTPPFRLKNLTHIHRQTKRTFSGPALQR